MRRSLPLLALAAVLLVSWRADAQEFVAELQGTHPGDVVCVLSNLPRYVPKKVKDDAMDRVTSWVVLRELFTRKVTLHAFLDSVSFLDKPYNPGSPSYRLESPGLAYDPAYAWQGLTFEDAYYEKLREPSGAMTTYVECLRDGAPAHPWDARLVAVELGITARVAATNAQLMLIRGPTTLSGTSLRFDLRPRDGNGHFGPGEIEHEVTIHAIGGSYAPASAVTNGQRATLYLQPLLPEFSFRLPESARVWSNATVRVSPANAPGDPESVTRQARVENGMLRGSALPGTEFSIETPHRLVRYKVGADDLDVLRATVSWSAPAVVGPLGRKQLACPDVTLPDYGAATCAPRAKQPEAARERCEYSCELASGFTLPTRLRLQSGSVEWSDTLAWGRFDSSSFASPAPALVLIPRPTTPELRRTYVVLGEPGGPRTSYKLDCPYVGREPPAMCDLWTSAVPRGMPNDLVYRYYGGARYRLVAVPEKLGAYTLEAPRAKPVVVAVRSGVDAQFRATNGKPSVGADLGLDLLIPTGTLSFELSAEWRVGPRTIDRGGSAIGSIASSAFAGDAGLLLCMPCAGSLPWLGWLGVEVGGAAIYPFASANAATTGEWVGSPEASLQYRFQPTDDDGWGLSAAAGVAENSEFLTRTRTLSNAVGLRLAVSLWAYVF